MSLIIDNPDWLGIVAGLANKKISFWDLPDQPSHFFPDQTGANAVWDAEELNCLVNDMARLRRQADELKKIIPAKSQLWQEQFLQAADEIELKIKKLLGNKVEFTSNKISPQPIPA